MYDDSTKHMYLYILIIRCNLFTIIIDAAMSGDMHLNLTCSLLPTFWMRVCFQQKTSPIRQLVSSLSVLEASALIYNNCICFVINILKI